MLTDLPRPSILIADDHLVFAEGLAESLKSEYVIIGLVTALDQLEDAVDTARPDVLVLDLSFHGASALPVLRRLSRSREGFPAVVVLTAHGSPALARASEEAGALAFLPKDVSTHELKLAISAAVGGRKYSHHSRSTKGMTQDVGVGTNDRVTIDGFSLTRKQVKVLSLLQAGLPRAEIATAMGTSLKGVDYHLQQIRKILGASHLRLLYVWATEHAAALSARLHGRYGTDET